MTTSNVKLLPLPEPKGDVAGGGLDWTDEEMQSYARVNAEHRTAALEDKYDDLWAVKETYREKVGILEQMLEGSNTFYEKITVVKDAEIEALRGQIVALKDALIAANAEAEMLRAKVERLKRELSTRGDYVNDQVIARAKRLEEALWEKVRDWTSDIDPREGDRMMAGWNGALEKCAREVEALLHTAAQPQGGA